MATSTEELSTRRNVTGAQVVLLLVGLVALLVILWFFLLRGGTEEILAPPPTTVPSTEPTPEDETDTDGKPDKSPLQTFEVFAPKDPFKPLISASSGGTSGAPATSTGDGTTDGAGATGGTNTGSAPSGGSDISGDAGGGGSQNVSGRRVRLIDTFRAGGEQRARVQVDGTVYTVGEGDRFAENFELVSISGDCVSVLYGDDQFSLCEGEEILK